MVPLLACSLVSLALTIERIIFWTKLNSKKVLSEMLTLAENGEFEQASKVANTSQQMNCVLVVASTYGDGEPLDDAAPFWEAYLRTLEAGRRLNAPWGMAIAPENFGRFSRALLVGNFGDGTLVAFNLKSGKQIDYLRDPDGKTIQIDGLWGLFFGNGASLGQSDFLYWTGGPNGEEDGTIGSLNWVGARNADPQ